MSNINIGSLSSLGKCECSCHKVNPYNTEHIYDSTGSLYFAPMQETNNSIKELVVSQQITTPDDTHDDTLSETASFKESGTCFEAFRASFPCCGTSLQHIKPLFEFSILRNILFIFYLLGVMLGNAGYVNSFIFLPPYVLELGYSKSNASQILMIGGFADLVGRLFGGWFGDLNIVKKHNLMAGCIMVVSFTNIAGPVLPAGFYTLIIMSISIGFFGGFYVSLIVVVLIEYIGLLKMPSAFALAVTFMGAFNAVFQLFLGFLRDTTGGYAAVYAVCGLFMFMCASLFFCEPIARRLEKWRQNKPTTNPATC